MAGSHITLAAAKNRPWPNSLALSKSGKMT